MSLDQYWRDLSKFKFVTYYQEQCANAGGWQIEEKLFIKSNKQAIFHNRPKSAPAIFLTMQREAP